MIGIERARISFNDPLYVIAVAVDRPLHERHTTDGVAFRPRRPFEASQPAWRPQPFRVTRSVDRGATFSDWRELGGVLVTTPGATSFMGQVYVVTEAVDAELYLQNSRP